MKKPSLKRKKQPTQQSLGGAPPASRKFGSKRKKAPTPQELASAPAPTKKSKQKRQKEPTPQELAASSAGPGNEGRAKKPLNLLRKPVGKLLVVGLLAVVVVFGLLQLLGGGDDEKEVRAALASYETASAKKDYQKLCDDLLSKSYVRQTASSGLPCEVALRTALEDVRNPTLQVLGVKLDGDKATARVRGSAAGQVPGEASYTLVREDDAWRIQPPRSGSPGSATP